ncbi:hypothetical protein CRG98_034994 [Punica granatum]|nr:hypothetical protein CRG98_034994 [Punica granatum]
MAELSQVVPLALGSKASHGPGSALMPQLHGMKYRLYLRPPNEFVTYALCKISIAKIDAEGEEEEDDEKQNFESPWFSQKA